MIEVPIKTEWLEYARVQSAEMGALRGSLTKGQGNLAGFVGECIACHIMKGEFDNTYEYDILVNIDGDSYRVDVKTKRTSVNPLPHYEASIDAKRVQDCDMYAFVRVKNDFTVGWFLGTISKPDMLLKATLWKKGEVDPTNNFTVRKDMYSLPISELEIDKWRKKNDITGPL